MGMLSNSILAQHRSRLGKVWGRHRSVQPFQVETAVGEPWLVDTARVGSANVHGWRGCSNNNNSSTGRVDHHRHNKRWQHVAVRRSARCWHRGVVTACAPQQWRARSVNTTTTAQMAVSVRRGQEPRLAVVVVGRLSPPLRPSSVQTGWRACHATLWNSTHRPGSRKATSARRCVC